MRRRRRPYESMTLTRHAFGAISKHSSVALNTRAPMVPTTMVERIDGCDVAVLAHRFGSPLYVISETRLRGEFRAFREAFRAVYPRTEVAYSYKTNYLSGICAMLHQEGAWAEVVSGLEYEMAERLAVSPARIILNGPFKTEADLERAVKDGAWINLDNLDELAVLEAIAGRAGLRVPVGIRVTAAVTEFPWGKFGFSLEAGLAEEACQRALAARTLRLAGLHVHLGTDLSSPEVFERLLARLLPLMATLEKRGGVKWELLDLGGGFPNRHRYAPGRTGMTPEQVFPAFASAIGRPLKAAFRSLKSRPRLVLEPGRAVVEHAGFLITTVAAVKRLGSGAKAAVLDAGVHLLPTAYYTVLDVAPTESAPLSVEEVTLYGPLCMQVDCLATGVRLPPLRRGAHLVVSNCGAYTYSQSMQFIQPRPAVVLVSRGRAELLREAESIEDFVARDRLPSQLFPAPAPKP